MPMFDDKIKAQLHGILKEMQRDIHLLFFEKESECKLCAETKSFVEEIAALAPRITVGLKDLQRDSALAAAHGVDKVPAISLSDRAEAGRGVLFFGFPGGYEINSFIAALLEVSGRAEELPAAIAKRITAIDRAIHLQVFVTLSCPYCPAAVGAAHRMAIENPLVRADMIDTALFPHLAHTYDVTNVPVTVINNRVKLVGAQPLEAILDAIDGMKE